MNNLTLLYGENTYLRDVALKKYRTEFITSEGDLNLTVLDGRETNPEAIIAACEALPFLGSKRLIIIRDFNFKQTAPELTEFIKTLPDHCQLIITTNKADARTVLYKALKKYGELQEFKSLKPAEFRHWLATTTREQKLTINPDALALLATYTLGDCAAALSELTKLATYTNGQTVKRADVEALTHPDLHTSVFALTDAIGARQLDNALAHLNDLTMRGENLIQVFFAIVSQLRTLLRLQAAIAKKIPTGQLASELKIHPFVIQKSIPLLHNFNTTELQTAYRRLLKIDKAIKTGQLSYSANNPTELAFALEKFVVSF